MILIQPFLELNTKDYIGELLFDGGILWYSCYTDGYINLIPDGCFEIIFFSKGNKITFTIPDKSRRNRIKVTRGLICGLRLSPEFFLALDENSLAKICFSGKRDEKKLREEIFPYIYETEAHPMLGRLLKKIINEKGQTTVYDLSEEFGYSERHINNIVKDNLGYGPKDFARFVRFQHALMAMLNNPNGSNSSFIEKLSYADQAHFQREFKSFTGMTPRRFLIENGLKEQKKRLS